MSSAQPRHQILYVSRIAPGLGREVFESICQVSRCRNQTLAMTGAMAFRHPLARSAPWH